MRKTTSSRGLSIKTTVDGKVSFGAADDGSAGEIKNTAKYVHDNKVSKTYDTAQGSQESISQNTGFGDRVFYTQKNLSVYYYPVLGQTSCPNGESGCSDDEKTPAYVEFSVPIAALLHVDGINQDWYQPVHEPGNVFFLPWNLNQLSQQFATKIVGSTRTTVNIEPLEAVNTLISSTRGAALKEHLRARLLLFLQAALEDFKPSDIESGAFELRRYVGELHDFPAKERRR